MSLLPSPGALPSPTGPERKLNLFLSSYLGHIQYYIDFCRGLPNNNRKFHTLAALVLLKAVTSKACCGGDNLQAEAEFRSFWARNREELARLGKKIEGKEVQCENIET